MKVHTNEDFLVSVEHSLIPEHPRKVQQYSEIEIILRGLGDIGDTRDEYISLFLRYALDSKMYELSGLSQEDFTAKY